MNRTIKQAGAWIKRNRWALLRIAVLTAVAVLPEAAGFASDIKTGMPWDTGVNKLQSSLTGPLPKAGSAISLSTAGLLWMFGESRVTQTAMRVALGSGLALSAPSAVSALSGVTVSGCLF